MFSVGVHSSGFWAAIRDQSKYVSIWEHSELRGVDNTIEYDTPYYLGYNFKKLYLNGVYQNTSGNSSFSSGTGARIGRLLSGLSTARYFNGFITEIMFYKSNLSEDQVAAIHMYFSNKYNI